MEFLTGETIAHLDSLAPLERITTAGQLVEDLRQAMSMLGQIRSAAIEELRSDGMSTAQIAARLDVSRQQVHRLQRREHAPVDRGVEVHR